MAVLALPYSFAGYQNVALYRIVTHSSSVDVNKCGHLVVDGSLDTYWESQPGKKDWLIIDLGSKKKINKVVINWGYNYGTEYRVSLLNNPNDENQVQTFTQTNGKGNVETVEFKDTEVRFVRLEINKVLEQIRGSVIQEIEVFGDAEERFIPSKSKSLSLNNLSLNGTDWRVQNQLFVKDKPEVISAQGYNDTKWIPAKVPGTILSDYANFGAFPDLLYGDNMHQVSDEFFSGNNFWYRTTVNIPDLQPQKRLFLDFSGINWKADVYFNSVFVGHIDGAFQRADFEVTKLVTKGRANTIAVLIYHNENWISSLTKVIRKSIGARTTNGDLIGIDSPTFMAASGWNWIPIVKGRNIGIWNDVKLEIREDVSINDPWVSSTLNLPDTTVANLTLQATFKNHSRQPVVGKLIVTAENLRFEYPVKLNPLEEKIVKLDKSDIKQLSVKNPKLWWPNGYGRQNLSKLTLNFQTENGISDTKQINYGIRQIDTKVINDILFFYCNGKRILLRGGNWGMPEALLRCDSAGYDTRVKLHKEANFNMIRNWVGMTGHEMFYDACDKYGMLIFDDFWLANPVDGPDPKDTTMFMNNVRDKIKWVRKHPSLALYCGRNEGMPPVMLDLAMRRDCRALDSTRHYTPSSADGELSGRGPYDTQSPAWYFEKRGKTLHSELGIISIPEPETMRRMMPEKNVWPINDMWAIHDYQWGRSEKFTARIESRYGKPASVDDYCRRAQLLNYESSRAMFESLQSNQGSGILLWMSQAAWPSMICQIYDHFFEYTGGFFGAKKGCEQFHVLYDSYKKEIKVANNTLKDINNVTLKASVIDLNGNKVWEKSIPFSIKSLTSETLLPFTNFANEKVQFLKLEIYSASGKKMNDNFYWLENENGNCLDLNDMPKVNPIITTTSKTIKGIHSGRIILKNQSPNITLLTKIKIKRASNGESVLPVYFSDNYISLLPGETREIEFSFDAFLTADAPVQAWIEGYNTDLIKVNL